MTQVAGYVAGEVTYEVDGHIAIFTIDGYNDLNPMTPAMYLQLHSHLLAFEDDANVRVGIIRGAGDHHFSVGGNLKRASGMSDTLLNKETVLKTFWNSTSQEPKSAWIVWDTLFARRTVKPIVAALNGYCLGAAMFVVGLHTDIRIAGESAIFGIPEARRGIAAGSGGATGFNSQIPAMAMSWMFDTSEPVAAKRAHQWHIVTEVVPDDQTFARAREVAELIAANPPAPLRAEKLGLLHLENVPYETAAFVASTFRALAQTGGGAGGPA
jgi:enoyl-CoA hydratase/carnithine racemase